METEVLERALDSSQSETLFEDFHKTESVPVILLRPEETKRFCLFSYRHSSLTRLYNFLFASLS
jgi:hypothetical protein